MLSPMQIIDSHTEGEPTRTVVSGFPALRGNTMAERRADFADRFDHLRRGLVLEPRGHNAVVGALLTDPVEPGSNAGLIFFNEVGVLGMCGHGTIGVAETLRFLGRASDRLTFDTAVGEVSAEFHSGGVTIRNVASRVLRVGVQVRLNGHFPAVTNGDLAYGGNGFFLAEAPESMLVLSNLDYLIAYTKALRSALHGQGDGTVEGVVIDHVELFAPREGGAKNFVLCPGTAYDRSPCGTGTSAKIACLAASNALAPGEPFEVESFVGGRFTARYAVVNGQVIPSITGRAFVTGRYEPVFSEGDPFAYGF